VETGIIARIATRPPLVIPAPVSVTLDSDESGAPVLVDGREVGVTPLVIKIDP
jgi:hypothetical protein